MSINKGYKSNRVRNIVAVGVFAALAYACTVVFHFKAGFLSFDLKDSVMAVASMLFGPLYGVAMSLIVALIEFATISTTEIYGLVMNIISSVTFVFVGSMIYSYKKSLAGAVVGMTMSVFLTTCIMLVANLIITPHYMGVSTSDVAAMIPTLLLPFNLTKYIVNAAVVFLIYKPITNIIRHAGFSRTYENSGENFTSFDGVSANKTKRNLTSWMVFGSAVVIAIAALVYFFVYLHGSVSMY